MHAHKQAQRDTCACLPGCDIVHSRLCSDSDAVQQRPSHPNHQRGTVLSPAMDARHRAACTLLSGVFSPLARTASRRTTLGELCILLQLRQRQISKGNAAGCGRERWCRGQCVRPADINVLHLTVLHAVCRQLNAAVLPVHAWWHAWSHGDAVHES